MSAHQSVEYDERAVAVYKTGTQLAHVFLLVALLIDVMYRGMFRDESAWDLMALIVVSGAIGTIYNARQKVLGKAWLKVMLVTVCVAAVTSVVLVVVTAVRKAM